MEGYLWGLAGFVTYALCRAVAGLIKKKFSIKDEDKESMTKMQATCDERREQTDEHFKAIDEALQLQNEANSVILTSIYALLVTAERGSANGEIKAAKEAFTATFKQKFCMK